MIILEIYGVRVLDCVAETMDGRKMKIIEDGCSTDDIIVTHVQYAENNQKAFADAMAFKFPDAEDVWIKCNVQTCLQRHEHLQILATENHICPKESVRINCINSFLFHLQTQFMQKSRENNTFPFLDMYEEKKTKCRRAHSNKIRDRRRRCNNGQQ